MKNSQGPSKKLPKKLHYVEKHPIILKKIFWLISFKPIVNFTIKDTIDTTIKKPLKTLEWDLLNNSHLIKTLFLKSKMKMLSSDCSTVEWPENLNSSTFWNLSNTLGLFRISTLTQKDYLTTNIWWMVINFLQLCRNKKIIFYNSILDLWKKRCVRTHWLVGR